MWTADKLVYRSEDDFIRAYQGSELLWKKSIPNNMIYYTSTDNTSIYIPTGGSQFWGVNLVSNTYSGGQGILTFDGPLTKIRYNAFTPYTGFEGERYNSFILPDTVTMIDYQAFMGCINITSFYIPDNVTVLEHSVFNRCSKLSSIHMSSSLQSIGDECFYDCADLETIVIPDTVTSIGRSTFNHCTKLNTVIVNAVVPPSLGESSFSDNASGRLIKVPAESLQAYKTAAGWSTYASSIVAQ